MRKMKNLLKIALFAVLVCSPAHAQLKSAKAAMTKETPSIHSFIVKDIDGREFYFSRLEGKKIIVVNTASKCGLTPQYAELQKLYDQYKDKGLVIVGFPSNDFADQEPEDNKNIAQFCRKNYGVTFPMMEKISVTGDKIHPLYDFLTHEKRNGNVEAPVKWNFQKFLINEKGEVVRSLQPTESVMADEVLKWIES